MNLKYKISRYFFALGLLLTTNVFAMLADEDVKYTKGSQLTDTVLMISPDHFEYNVETATTNAFQKNTQNFNTKAEALNEFNNMMAVLKENNVRVLSLKSNEHKTPDAVFPNNWFVTLKEQSVKLIIFPMLNNVRRLEKQENNLKSLLLSNDIKIETVCDLTPYENQNKALEGTGSLVLDRQNKIAYSSLSPRTDKDVLNEFSKASGYKPITFTSHDKNSSLIYHTNVMMSVGDGFSVVCLESIKDQQEKENLIGSLKICNKEIVPISLDQMHSMCGNILQVKTLTGDKKIIMSKTASNAFTKEQHGTLEKFGKIISVEIPTIETIGGGSARCMLAEIFY